MRIALVGVEDGVEGQASFLQMVDVFLLLGNFAFLIELEVVVLGFDDIVAERNDLLVVAVAVSHGSAPQVDVGHQCVDSIFGKVSPIPPVEPSVSTRQHDNLVGFLQVVQTVLQHHFWSALFQQLHLAVVLIGVGGVRNIAECTYQIEVAQAAQSQHLSPYHLAVAQGEFRVFFHHLVDMVQHDVTVVDDLIEGAP